MFFIRETLILLSLKKRIKALQWIEDGINAAVDSVAETAHHAADTMSHVFDEADEDGSKSPSAKYAEPSKILELAMRCPRTGWSNQIH